MVEGEHKRSLPVRRSLRLPEFDYGQPGAYFITICTHERELLFEDPLFAEVARTEWHVSTQHRTEVRLDAFVVMPNHVHGIVWLLPVGARRASPVSGAPAQSLGAFVGAYKSTVTRSVNIVRAMPGAPVWQRGYYEHVVRDEADLERVREYIRDNPARWEFDREHPRAQPDAAEMSFWDERT